MKKLLLIILLLIACGSQLSVLKKCTPIAGYRILVYDKEHYIATFIKTKQNEYFEWDIIIITNIETYTIEKIFYKQADELIEWDALTNSKIECTRLWLGNKLVWNKYAP